jgi:hypothetical protein
MDSRTPETYASLYESYVCVVETNVVLLDLE